MSGKVDISCFKSQYKNQKMLHLYNERIYRIHQLRVGMRLNKKHLIF